MVLEAVHGTRALVPGRGDPGYAGVLGPVFLQTKHSRSKIRNSSSLSSQRSFRRFAPRLVAGVHVVTQPVLTSLDSSFGKSSSVKVKRYVNLPLLSPPALECSSCQLSTTSCRPPHLCVRPHHPVIVEPFVNREVQLWAVNLRVKDEVLQVCVILANSRCPLANSLVFISGLPVRHLLGYKTQQQETSRHFARVSTRGDLTR